MTRLTRTAAALAVALVAAGGLSGCADQKVGSAAVVDGSRITTDEVQQADPGLPRDRARRRPGRRPAADPAADDPVRGHRPGRRRGRRAHQRRAGRQAARPGAQEHRRPQGPDPAPSRPASSTVLPPRASTGGSATRSCTRRSPGPLATGGDPTSTAVQNAARPATCARPPAEHGHRGEPALRPLEPAHRHRAAGQRRAVPDRRPAAPRREPLPVTGRLPAGWSCSRPRRGWRRGCWRPRPGTCCAPARRSLAAEGHPLEPYLAAEGVAVETGRASVGRRATSATRLLDRTAAGDVVWLVGARRRPRARPRPGRGARRPARADVELEVLPGSYDLPGARLLDLVAVMDRLRSPGGCPWDARADPRLAGDLPARGDLRDPRGDRHRRPRPPARGARRPAAAGRLPLPDRRRGRRTTRGRSTTSPGTSSTSWYAGTRTCSPAPRPRRRPTSRPAGSG